MTSSTLPKFEKHPYSWTFTSTPPLGHCLCDVIIHIPKGLICSFLWPIFSSCFARISPTVCPNFTHCLPEFHPLFARIWGGSCPPCPPASYAYGSREVFCQIYGDPRAPADGLLIRNADRSIRKPPENDDHFHANPPDIGPIPYTGLLIPHSVCVTIATQIGL